MRQHDLNRAIARVTGDTVSTIRQFGFSLIEPNAALPSDASRSPCREPLTLDWDTPSTVPTAVPLRELTRAMA